MFKRRHYGKLLTSLWLFSCLIFFLNEASALNFVQDTSARSTISRADTLINKNNPVPGDTLAQADTATSAKQDTTGKKLALEYKLVRHADDSIVQDLNNKKVYLYGKAEITYGDIDLKAAFISVDFNNNTVFAQGMKDTTGKMQGTPEFKQGNQVYDAQTIRYDFVSKKGIIHGVNTKQNEGYLHGKKVKRMPDNSFNVKNGEFTTCDLKDPDYAFRFSKARVIPGKLLVTGPVYMEVEGIPTPLALPFGIFPNNPKRTSGLIMPSYGESTSQGFYLMGGGYFWNINDHLTLKVTGDIYTGGSWSVSPILNYRKRYRYNGSLALSLGKTILSTKGSPDYSNSRSFKIRWSFAQDPKTHPNGTFTANVNIMSRNYVKYTTVDQNTLLSNTFSSSIAYQRNFGKHAHFSATGNFTQNVNQHTILLSLPTINLSVDQFYPFRTQNSTKKRLLDNLSISYSMQAQNKLNTTDSTIFTNESMRKMQNGITQTIPITLPLKVLKYFTLSNSININDWIYTSSIRRRWVDDTVQNPNGLPGEPVTDTIPGFNNVFAFHLSSGLSTTIYGMLKFKKGPIRAIRHVITPKIGYTYMPDFSNSFWGYASRYTNYADTSTYASGREVMYSRYEGSLFGGPPMGRQSNLTFSISNSLEIKVPSKKDTVTGMKKIPIIQDLTISGSYNFAADSLNLSNISVSGRTTLWKGMSIQYNASLDPYVKNASGSSDINKTMWAATRRLFQKNTSWNLSLDFKLDPSSFKSKNKKPTKVANPDSTATPQNEIQQPEEETQNGIYNQQVDWKIPWSLSLKYNFRYSNLKSYREYFWYREKRLVQTLGFNGQLSISKNWKFNFTSGWDFTNHELAFTSVNINRNLHCWEMRFSWIPLGPRKSWNFTIQIKAGMLKDLKITKQKSFLEKY